ncbi:MAG: ABC transporter permease [Planctomycetota bacterium]|nr:ABC transporter permease [Planctomycetota bacterium]
MLARCRHFLTDGIGAQHLTLIILIVLISTLMQFFFPLFLDPLNVETLLMNFFPEIIVSIGMTMVIITGGIDISVASVYAFAEIIVAKAMVEAGWDIVPATLFTLFLCCLIGLMNGYLADILSVHPMIVTMGTLLTLRGVNLAITDGRAVSGYSDAFAFLGQGHLWFFPIPILVAIVLAIIFGYLLNNHRYFRQIYFIGGNEKAARVSGVNVRWVKVSVYVICSFLAGLAGVLGASKYGAAHWGHGNMMEMKAIAAVAVGGANLNGGSGSIGATMLGVCFLAIVNNAFYIARVETFWYDVVNGGMLVLAVAFSLYVNHRNEIKLINQKIRASNRVEMEANQ